MSWNYRVLIHRDPRGDCYMIHEVFYKKNGEIEAWGKDGMHPLGETMTELKSDIRLMRRAFNRPVLEIKGKKLIEVM